MQKLRMHSTDLTAANIAAIKNLFPQCVTEAPAADGTLTHKIDFDLLRQELADELVEGPAERYQLNWPGKREAILTANAPIAKSLRPERAQSVDFDTTQNVFIEGDNLEALKLLQETYLGKVKLIYIDPPYNTGRNYIYKNDFKETKVEYLKKSGQFDASNGHLVANSETNGRFHSDWLTMIYARLKIAKYLLKSDGVLVCAIDENEFSTLSLILKEIFGDGSYEHSYISIVHNPRGQQGNNFSYVNEYLLFIYPADGKKYLADFPKSETDSRTLRDSGTESDRTDARNCFYPFIINNGVLIEIGEVPADDYHPASANVYRDDGSIEIWPISDDGTEKKWRYARQSVEQIISKLSIKQGRQSLQVIFNKDIETIRSVWVSPRYDSSEYGTKLLDNLVEGAGFTFPKSLHAVYDCIYAATFNEKDAIILDFFAGSATTAHAVMKLNLADAGNRKFIMVQIAQECEPNTKPYKAGYRTIAEISKERIRRAGSAILVDWHTKHNQLSFGANITSTPGTGRDGTGRDGTGRDGTGHAARCRLPRLHH
jgi:adenine-specific DNA-methyltransferase